MMAQRPPEVITTQIQYIAWRKMWRVTVLLDDKWIAEAYFHTKWGANAYADEERQRRHDG